MAKATTEDKMLLFGYGAILVAYAVLFTLKLKKIRDVH
jgi:hypothetical protein